jgi:hypothetical protein
MPSLRTLVPGFREEAEAFFDWARSEVGAGLVVTSARRTSQEQLRLYQASLAGQNNGLPATPPGLSDHEIGLAFDMARLNVDPLTDPWLPVLGAEWQRRGGIWWSGDPVHFGASRLQVTDRRTQLRRRKGAAAWHRARRRHHRRRV